MSTCESCWRRPGIPVCIDDNMETYLCKTCRKDCERAGMTVEILDV